MKVQMKIRVRAELEIIFTRKTGRELTYLLYMYYNGAIISHSGNQKRLRKMYPNVMYCRSEE